MYKSISAGSEFQRGTVNLPPVSIQCFKTQNTNKQQYPKHEDGESDDEWHCYVPQNDEQ